MLTTLKDFGFGKASMEDMIVDEMILFEQYINDFLKKSDGVVIIQNVFNVAVLNIIWKALATSPPVLFLRGCSPWNWWGLAPSFRCSQRSVME